MIQDLHELVNPLNIYALAVLLTCAASIAAGTTIKTYWPHTDTTGFCVRFAIAAVFFKLAYSTYESLMLSGHLNARYLNLDAVVLLIMFSVVMGLSMYVFDLRRQVRRTEAARKEASRIIADAYNDLESSNGHSHSSRPS